MKWIIGNILEYLANESGDSSHTNFNVLIDVVNNNNNNQKCYSFIYRCCNRFILVLLISPISNKT